MQNYEKKKAFIDDFKSLVEKLKSIREKYKFKIKTRFDKNKSKTDSISLEDDFANSIPLEIGKKPKAKSEGFIDKNDLSKDEENKLLLESIKYMEEIEEAL